MDSPRQAGHATAWPWLLPIVLTVVSAVVLGFRLDERYLWQDEAATALLGQRLMTHGRPLGYDGRNLLTMDTYRSEEFASGSVPTASADAAVRFFAERGDFKADTTWIRHPWGAFLLAGLSLETLGTGSWQARLPFVLSALSAAVALWWFVRRHFEDPRLATLAWVLCLGNVYWLLHMRQCHYNAPSCLMLILTLAAYLRWQERRRFGATAFVLAGWLWFQFDYGSVWPALVVLYADACRAAWPRLLRPVGVGLAFAAITAPFVHYYELFGRSAFGSATNRGHLLLANLFYVNQFMLPFLLLPVLAWLIWSRRAEPPRGQTRILGLCLAIIAATLLWLPWVIPMTFYRYLVHLTPLAALLVAWVLVRLAERCAPAIPPTLSAAVLALLLLVVPLPASPVSRLFPPAFRARIETGLWLRPEALHYLDEMAGRLPDPNREVIRAVQARLDDGDEILVNYEDRPFMFYTGARVRGGIPAFRVDDRTPPPPRFLVFRRSADFTEQQLFLNEARRHVWRPIPVEAPDVPWSNTPDPWLRHFLYADDLPRVVVLERVIDGAATSP